MERTPDDGKAERMLDLLRPLAAGEETILGPAEEALARMGQLSPQQEERLPNMLWRAMQDERPIAAQVLR
jgi:hypothetical protein